MAGRPGTLMLTVVLVGLLAASPASSIYEEKQELVEEGYELHPPIFIDDNWELLEPRHGVRSGNGTADNPYRIHNWTIATGPSGPGIRMMDTHSHVVIENVTVYSLGLTNIIPGYCEPHHLNDCTFGWGLDLIRVANLTVRNVRLVNVDIALALEKVVDSHFEDVWIGPDPDGSVGGASQLGVQATSSSVTMKGIEIVGSLQPLRTFGGSLLLEDLHVRATSSTTQYGGVSYLRWSDAVVLNSTFDHQILVVNGDHAAVVGSSFSPPEYGLHALRFDDTWANRDNLACGNHFSGLGSGTALRIGDASVRVVGNHFEENRINLQSGADTDALTLLSNTFHATSTGLSVQLEDHPLVARDNAFLAHRVNAADGHDVTHNWWGDASGPSGLGLGTGADLYSTGTVTFDPWLTTAPATGPDAVDCDAELAAWRTSS